MRLEDHDTVVGMLVALIVLLSTYFWKRSRGSVADGPLDEAYKAYTTEFDRVVSATDLPEILRHISPDAARGFLLADSGKWQEQRERSAEIYRKLADRVRNAWQENDLANTVIVVLVDQSGSMRGERMQWVAAGVRRLSEELGYRGAKVAVAGYTTAGWHGGFARAKWLADGRPRRPGRLCALLHILYQPFEDECLDEEAWRQMLNPDVLRENVDGESIEWAAGYLRHRTEARRILLVVSDGAPVDDSTLLNNGPSYMHRHFLTVRDGLLEANDVELLALGADYRVEEYYPVSADVQDAAQLVDKALELILTGP
jgi:cobaltochelatase CobT